MANVVHSDVLDHGLDVLDDDANVLHIVSQDPGSYTEATVTYSLGSKSFATGTFFSPPEPGTPNGRAVASAQITDGNVTANGTATGWAVVDTVTSRLLANGDLASPQVVTSGNTFQLASFKIRIPNQ